jgi:3-hydroxyisobutyrate dehydrogenase-like beta-hydroxyacid dehydrogenase
MKMALLHPGQMGVTVGACAIAAGHTVGWMAHGRSEATEQRATDGHFEPFHRMAELLHDRDVVVVVCPPEAARATAKNVAESGFKGLYLDANAISPNTAVAIRELVESAGATYVDGSIIGPPAAVPGTTRLYLSGEKASIMATYFTNTALEAIVIEGGASAASAIKMCYAAWTKGSAALLLAVGALAQAENISSMLEAEWARSIPDLADKLANTAATSAPKAWRFAGEMHEIANTFDANELPGGFHRGAAETFALLKAFKNPSQEPNLNSVLQTMLKQSRSDK